MAVLSTRRREHEEEEESVFVSMTDLMISILFIVMILMAFFAASSVDEEIIPLEVHEDAISSRDSIIASQERRLIELEALLVERQVMIARLESRIDLAEVRDTELEQRLEEYLLRIAELETEIEELEKELEILREMEDRKLAAALEAITTTRRTLLESIQAELIEAGVRVEVDPVSGVIRFDESVIRFASASYDPSEPVEDIMRSVARILEDQLACFTLGPASRIDRACNPAAAVVEAIQIEGHTDNVRLRPRTNIADNLDLSAKRAASTYRVFVDEAPALLTFQNANYVMNDAMTALPAYASLLDEGLFGQPVLSVSGYGATRPVSSGGDISADRRIDLRFIMMTPRTAGEADVLFRVVSDAMERVGQ